MKASKKINAFFFLFALLLSMSPFPFQRVLYCGHPGFKYFKNYSPKDYDGQSQNWDIIQDKRGIVYIGNNGGVIEFDGVSWRLIKVPNHVVRSMAIDRTGTVYVGGKEEMGFLSPDSSGRLHYVSLLEHLTDDQRNFPDVWGTDSTKDGIYFRTRKLLFRWKDGRMSVWRTENAFNASFTIDGNYFIHRRNAGLMRMENNSITLVPGGEKLAGLKIYMTVAYDTQKLLIGTDSNGLFIYDGKNVIPFPTGADDYLREKKISHGIRLFSPPSEPGEFAVATRFGGVVVIDSTGRLKETFTRGYGLQDDMVWQVFEDFQGNLWLALNKGVSKIEYNSPISTFDERSGLTGLALSVVTHRDRLYAGTTRGLFVLTPRGKFLPVPGISAYCRSLLSTGDSLLAATSSGIFQVGADKKRKILETQSYVLVRSGKNRDRIWAGTNRGLVSLYLTGETGRWTEEHTYKETPHENHTIVEDKKGNLWLGTRTKGVIHVGFPGDGTVDNPVVTPYHTAHKLPPGEVNVFWAARHVMFATPGGIYRFNEKDKVFIPDAALGEEFADGSRGVFRIVEDSGKHIWFHSKFRNIQAIPLRDGTFALNKKPFHRLSISQVNGIYPSPGGETVWFARDEGLIRYDTTVKKNYDLDFFTLIRNVSINGNPVFDGFKTNDPGAVPVLGHKDRNIRFRFAAPFFEGETGTKYQYFLEGYDHHWSAWTDETRKDYTNLDPGKHTFRVRAKNIYGNVSKEDVFRFKILPPWYKTWWAFFIYAAAAFLTLFLIVKWRSRKLVMEKERLERIVRERTKQLEEMDKVKSRFFANISHEFRTPLTLIMGPLEQMLSQSPPGIEEKSIGEKRQKKKLRLMLRNSQRLLNLINQLLDLSKLESGKMRLNASPQNIIPFIKGITASFEMAAEQNELELHFFAEEETVTLNFDPEMMEKVMANLLSNAVKFTPPGGRVTVTVTRVTRDTTVDISVCDTGIGIPGNQLPHIFDHFYQAAGVHEHKSRGSGIGLALAKELVTLHHGSIDVRSSEGPGSGTEFIVRLPMGREYPGDGGMEEIPKPGGISTGYAADVEKEDGDSETETEFPTGEEGKSIILVVEDSADVRDYIRGALEPVYTVEEAADGREGIEKAREIVPDLIVSDIMMPETDGYELCRVLKKDRGTSHIPIILLTAKASDENVLQGLETGADDYVTKPFNTRMLLARIKNLIELRTQLHMNMDREMTLRPAEMKVSTVDREFIKELKDVIEANISDPDFNVEDLGRKLYMSRASLYRKILALSGKTPSDFIRSYRLKQAAQLLRSKSGSITEVAFEVGFSSRTYFTKCFKEKFHQLPSEYLEG